MTGNPNDLSLHPDHLADLRKSGLSDETIREARIYSVTPKDIPKKLEGHFTKVESLLAFPYPGCEGFERYKLFPPQQTENGTVKYYQRAGIPPRLYPPARVTPNLSDPSIPIYLTEGEKKTLKAVQESLPCIGLGGLWNWCKKDDKGEKHLIPDFDKVEWKGRTVYLIPDNDWLNPDHHGERKNLRQAVYELAYRLIDRGARVYVIDIPPGPEKGLDDFLCHHTVEEFQNLPKREIRRRILEEMIKEGNIEDLQEILSRISKLKSGTERDIFIEQLSKRFKISKRAIQKDLKVDDEDKEQNQKPTTLAYFPGLVDLCTCEGGIGFLVKGESGLEIFTIHQIEGKLYTPPGREYLPFLLSRGEKVLKFFGEEDGQLFDAVENYLKRFSFLLEPQFVVVTLFAFLTYIADHPDIHYFPMLLFWAAPERGKSRTGKALVHICYRGIHLVDLREANLFRYSENLRATLFFDIMDLWKKAERNQSEDILLLRYEKGAQVARVLYPEKGAFKDMVHYSVYGPTVMASNEPVHHILDTRCLAVSMPNRPGDYENLNPEKAQEIRDRLTAWRARVMDKPLPKAEPLPGLNGRLWDISTPLLQVGKLVCPDRVDVLKAALLDIAGQRLESKQETIEGQLISIIFNLSPKALLEWNIPVEEILNKLNEQRPEGHKATSQYVGKKLKAIGLKAKKIRGYSEVKLTRAELDTLLTQFGLENENPVDVPPVETLPNSTILQNSIHSNGCLGRELVESGRECLKTLPDSLPGKDEEVQGVLPLVESSRELIDKGPLKKQEKINPFDGEI